MNEPGVQALVDQETMAARVEAGELPDWAVRHFETFTDALLGERDGTPFPCYFGANSVRDGEPLYAAVPSLTEKEALLSFRDALLEYLDVYREMPGRTSFVTFFRPPEREFSEGDYHEALWHLLQFLHVHDPDPWPADIPTDPDDPEWEFCFGGEPMFPTCRAPFYEERRSRYCPVGLEITFQPRSLFDGITADTEAGRQARETIQSRMAEYDGVCPHADLGDWGVDGDREWPQYLFREDPEDSPDECPIVVTREHPKAAPPRSAPTPETRAADD
ncbi:YqcI/YcgG family protein [Halogeometricum luteum]|uniref:YqcI/YcgG family protein n=1 Tax=Halogeometricum luteum TaxID=2950537 RepID=A0ABU2G1Q4_9EURY|nr:YqcI/YcgG family protein [Halogeometricum sp. S3BR5-2]MDS0294223.1 YqcI/YcgG family protein [Halogeometricum sp. S3BR5-2]